MRVLVTYSRSHSLYARATNQVGVLVPTPQILPDLESEH